MLLPLEVLECCSPLVSEPLDEDQAAELSRVFKALGDPVRLRLFSLVASYQGGEACVCDISGFFDVSQPTISHHLKVRRGAREVAGQNGQVVESSRTGDLLDTLEGDL